jgi:hypothetical protein
MNSKLLPIVVFCALTTSSVYGQDDFTTKADKKINKITSYKKYEIKRMTKADVKVIGDSLVRGTMYLGKKGSYGMDILEFKMGSIKKIDTYYFIDGLFAFDEETIFSAMSKKSLRYYFAGGDLFKVVDEHGVDQTNGANKKEIHDRIKKLYTSEVIVK